MNAAINPTVLNNKTSNHKVSEFIRRVYGTEGATPTPPPPQTITHQCRLGEIPAELKGAGKRKTWYIDWEIYQKKTGDHLVDRILEG